LLAKLSQQRTDVRKLALGVGELIRQLGQLDDCRVAEGAEESLHAAFEPKALLLEPERVRVAARERILERGARRQLGAFRQFEQRPNLGQDRGETIVQGRSIIHATRAVGMGHRAYLLWRLGPCLVTVVLLLLWLGPPARAADPTLTARLDQALKVPHVDPSRTAALAVDLRTGAVVYARNQSLALIPASNQKLPVAYAALSLLGPGFRFHTEVVGSGALVGDVWHGDLWLRGFGDPTLEPADLETLAAEVASWGIRRVDGAVYGDESWFDARRVAPGWRPSFLIGESPPLSALVVDRGRYRGRTSANPALAAASLFRQTLEAADMPVSGRARTGVLTTMGLPLARDVSEPLADVVRFMGRESDNYTAEVLVKQLGALYAEQGTTAAGVRVIRGVLEEAGVPLGGVRLADGSGLSRLDRLTATALVALLEAGLAEGELRDAFLDSLAVAGVDGTLEDRLESSPARGKVIAKTGTTSAASALSGFVRDRYVFSILQNGRPIATYWARLAQDRFATALAAAA
jgi:D-alanyl-D-alanine carboxypeptidase/D-alanyl-D-alanine-endopeptidase (penicillin-binding protein 4)